MSVSGLSGDALAKAGHYRAHTDSAFSKPAMGGGDQLLQQAILEPISLSADAVADAKTHLGRVVNTHGCVPPTETCPGHCPDPAAHQPAIDAGVDVLHALFQPVRPRKIERKNSHA